SLARPPQTDKRTRRLALARKSAIARQRSGGTLRRFLSGAPQRARSSLYKFFVRCDARIKRPARVSSSKPFASPAQRRLPEIARRLQVQSLGKNSRRLRRIQEKLFAGFRKTPHNLARWRPPSRLEVARRRTE